MTATVVIVGYRAYAELEQCLASLAAHEPGRSRRGRRSRGRRSPRPRPDRGVPPRHLPAATRESRLRRGRQLRRAACWSWAAAATQPGLPDRGAGGGAVERGAGRASGRGRGRWIDSRRERCAAALGTPVSRHHDGAWRQDVVAVTGGAGQPPVAQESEGGAGRRHRARGLGQWRLHAHPPRGLRPGARVRRGVLPLLGGRRLLQAGRRRGLAHPVRAGRRGDAPDRPSESSRAIAVAAGLPSQRVPLLLEARGRGGAPCQPGRGPGADCPLLDAPGHSRPSVG